MIVDEYRRKCVSADEAVKAIKDGDWVEYAWGASHAGLLGEAIARRKEELHDINLRGGVILKPLAFVEADPEGEHFTWNSMHMGGYERRLAEKSLAYYIPIKYSEVPRFIRENCRTDVVAIQVAPMDEHGYFNFGVSVSHYAAAIEKARTVIVEVNEDMPGFTAVMSMRSISPKWITSWKRDIRAFPFCLPRLLRKSIKKARALCCRKFMTAPAYSSESAACPTLWER
jgi:acyl-CoA hydrolase